MQLVMDPALPVLFTVLWLIFLTGLLFLLVRQPVLIAYLLCGIALGPNGFDIITDVELVHWLGNFGVILLLFFLGMEMPLDRLLSNWRSSFFATILQVVGSVLAVWVIGSLLNWSLARIVLLGFVISLSSTSIIIRLLKKDNQLERNVVNDVIGVTLMQALEVIPMLLIIVIFTKNGTDSGLLIKQIIGVILILLLFYYLSKKKYNSFSLGRILQEDEDMQVFAAGCICFGAALITGFLGLSTTLGSLLSQINKFSFVFAAIGLQVNIINYFSYKVTVALIAITIFMRPWWVAVFKRKFKSAELVKWKLILTY